MSTRRLFTEAAARLLKEQFARRPHSFALVIILFLIGVSYVPATVFSLVTDPLAFYAGMATKVHRGIIPGTPVIDPAAGAITQTLGKISADSWLSGKVPWWNPYSGAGLPLAAEMQSSSLFLPFVLVLSLQHGVILLRVLMMALAGVSTFALLRYLGVGSFAALTGAVLYSFNGTFAWFQHAAIFPLPFLPLLLWGIERARSRADEGRGGGWGLIAVSIAFSLLAGFPETAYLDGLLGVVWVLARSIGLRYETILRFGGKSLAGCLTGVLMAAPLLLPFAEYLKYSAAVHADFADRALPPSSLAQLFFPYVFGPIEGFLGADNTSELVINWGNIGGYFGLTPVVLAAMALVRGRQLKVLRFVLAAYVVLFVARSIGMPWAMQLFHLMPGISVVAVYRYGLPACEMAVAILVALYFDSWRTTAESRRGWPILAALPALVFAAYGLYYAWHLMSRFIRVEHRYPLWLVSSAAWAAVSLLLCCWLASSRPTLQKRIALGALVAGEAILFFSIPLLSGRRQVTVDMKPIRFLQANLGLSRYYSLGPIGPNYGSFFHLASIDHSMLPVSKDWVRYIGEELDPDIDPVTFSGNAPPPQEARDDALRRNVEGFERAGVKYVVTPPASNPFLAKVPLFEAQGGNRSRPLPSGERFAVDLPAARVKAGVVNGIGTYVYFHGKRASGSLEARLCARSACASGSVTLDHATDFGLMAISLTEDLPVQAGESLRLELRRGASDTALSVWVWPTAGDWQPHVTLIYRSPDTLPRLAMESEGSRVYELPHPAAYFSSLEGTCEVVPRSREQVSVDCRAPSIILRRELYYPGWQAAVNGSRAENVVRAQSIFQSIPVPAGRSTVVFSYAPVHIGWAYLAMTVAIMLLLYQSREDFGFLRGLVRRREEPAAGAGFGAGARESR